jgi:type I restriction enzyme R subunit
VSVLSDIVSLVRYAIHEKNELYPFKEDVDARFADWIEQQKQQGVTFTGEQMLWLEAIRDHVGTNIEIDKEDFDDFPFVQMGGLGKAYKLFGEKLQPMLAELNEVLVA